MVGILVVFLLILIIIFYGRTSPSITSQAPLTEEDVDPTTFNGGLTKYNCNEDIYNCIDFQTHTEAQTVYDACGDGANDVHDLDRDKDGIACEALLYKNNINNH